MDFGVEPIHILLVEDNPGDARLVQEALKESGSRNRLSVVQDGEEAMHFLRRLNAFAEVERPDIILLDLNLPRMDGRQVLGEVKADPDLRSIPVIVLTTSSAESDIVRTYDLHANCFVTKPEDLDEYLQVIKTIEDFWCATAKLPARH